MDLLSLLLFCLAIFLGFYKKINTGIICYALSLVVATLAEIPAKTVVASFNSDIFIMLLGTTCLFSIANENKCLEVLTKKLLFKTKGKTNLILFGIYGITLLLSSLGAGCLPSMTIMTLFAMNIAVNSNINPLFLGLLTMEGADGGNLSPLATTGIVGNKLCESIGVVDTTLPLYVTGVLSTMLNVLLAYVVFKGYKCKAVITEDKPNPLSKKQLITLFGILVFAFIVFVFKTNIGLTAFGVAVILMLLGVCDEDKAISLIPWNTLVMTTGVMLYISLMTKLGGIKLASNFVVSLMTQETTVFTMGVASGILSLVSSTTAVVMPTMISMIPSVVEHFAGANPFELVSAIVTSAHISGASPLSSGGALVLSAYVAVANPSKEKVQEMFVGLFVIAFVGIIYQSLLSSFGMYAILK